MKTYKIVIGFKEQKAGMAFHLRRLRFSYGSGFFNGALLLIFLHSADRESKALQNWFFSALFFLLLTAFSYINWRSQKSDCDELAKLIAQHESGADSIETL